MESYKRTGEGRESEGMGGTKLNNNRFRTTLMLGLHDMSESQEKKRGGDGEEQHVGTDAESSPWADDED